MNRSLANLRSRLGIKKEAAFSRAGSCWAVNCSPISCVLRPAGDTLHEKLLLNDSVAKCLPELMWAQRKHWKCLFLPHWAFPISEVPGMSFFVCMLGCAKGGHLSRNLKKLWPLWTNCIVLDLISCDYRDVYVPWCSWRSIKRQRHR